MINPRLEDKVIENKVNWVEKRSQRLTVMDGHVGIDIRANNNFYNLCLKPIDFPFEFIAGKIGLATCTDTTILISQESLPQFLRLFMDYSFKYRLCPEIEIKESNFNFFTDEEKPVTYIEIYDKNKC